MRDPEGYNNRLRVCAYDSQWFLAYSSKSYDGMYFCPKHLQVVVEKTSNPQPNSVVSYIDDDIRRYVVLRRDGDMLTVRRLGFPDDPEHTVSVHCVWDRSVSIY